MNKQNKKLNQTDVIRMFINSETEFFEFGNVKIVKNQLFHFNTPILEKIKDAYIFNESNYSDVTRFFQKKILNEIKNKDSIIRVSKVVMNYSGSLEKYIK